MLTRPAGIACNWNAARARLGRGYALAGLALLGAGINAWILTPLVLFHTRLIENEPDPIGLAAYTDPSRLFSLFRDAGNPYPVVTADVNAQLPVLALLWALICGAAYWRFAPRGHAASRSACSASAAPCCCSSSRRR